MELRICLVSSDFVPNSGGVAAHVSGLAAGLSRLGHDVTVVTTTLADEFSRATPDVRIVSFSTSELHAVRDIEFITRASFSTLPWQKFDVVHWHGLWGDTGTARLVRRAALRVFTNHTSMFLKRAESPFWRSVLRHWLRAADTVICPSIELRERTIELLPNHPVRYIPNGIDPDIFAPCQQIQEERAVLLAPRRLVPKNGLHYLIQAMPRIRQLIPNAELWLAGSGIEEVRLKTLAAELGIANAVRFLGNVPNSKMREYYCRSSVVVIPSLVEATSIAALEAGSCAKPIVATKVGGLPYVVRDGETGVLVPPKDPGALATAIAGLLSDPARRQRYGRTARKMVQDEFSWLSVAKMTADHYMHCTRSR